MKRAKVCLTTYVYGDKYQDYIPLLLYSIGKAYPDYYAMIFLYKKLRSDIAIQLDIVRTFYTNFEIIEDKFSDCPNMTPLKSQSLRWVLWDDKFHKFDYLYIVDIDIFYIKEPIDLHLQHVAHARYLNLPYSNIKRKTTILSHKPLQIARWIKYSGLKGLFGFIKKNGMHEYRATGLHFVNVKEYYKKLTTRKLAEYTKLIYKSSVCYKVSSIVADEAFLFWMLNDMELNPQYLGLQSNSTNMLNFENPEREEFRPHHGIHLGIFRSEADKMPNSTKAILDSEPYKYYIDEFKQKIVTDPLFNKLLLSAPERINDLFIKLYQYYEI